MKFWDSSAVVPLLVEETASPQIRRLARSDQSLVVWWGTRSECVAALARRRRNRGLAEAAERVSRAVLNSLASGWNEIAPSELLRNRCERLLALHPLSTADSFQLSAALIWSEESGREKTFVCLDAKLREAAQRESFLILPK